MKLYIDATDNLRTVIRIGTEEFVRTNAVPQDQDVLRAIVEALRLQGYTLQEISEIEVNPGPGSFTGTRVGVAIASALAFALGVKVNGQEPPITPVYSEEPHIAKSKKR